MSNEKTQGCLLCGCTCQQTAEFRPLSTPTTESKEQTIVTPFDTQESDVNETTNVAGAPSFPFHTEENTEVTPLLNEKKSPVWWNDIVVDSFEGAEVTLLNDSRLLSGGVDGSNYFDGANAGDADLWNSTFAGMSHSGLAGELTAFDRNEHANRNSLAPPDVSKTIADGNSMNVLCQSMCPFDTDEQADEPFATDEMAEEAAQPLTVKSPPKKTDRGSKRPASPSQETQRMIQQMYDKGDEDEGQKIVPRELDVLMGKGTPINNHAGNITFRKEVQRRHAKYDNETDGRKFLLAHAIVHSLVLRGSRFLRKDKKSGVWQKVSLKRAYDKAQQCLRDGAVKRRQAKEGA